MARLPNNSQRLVNVGSTGTGKTVAGLWHLSQRNFSPSDPDGMPWIMVDQKGDALIATLGAVEIPYKNGRYPLPEKPGLYVVRPLPIEAHELAMEGLLWDVWARENVGLYIDEGYMFAKSRALNSIYTQGRSKHIPVITNSQRPVWLSRFTFSEADFFQVFRLNDVRDVDSIRTMLPELPKRYQLKPYHSLYYDVAENQLTTFSPVPKPIDVRAVFHAKLVPPKKVKVFF